MRKPTSEARPESSPGGMAEEDNSTLASSELDVLHNRIQSKLNELHADFKQLETDVRGANRASSRAHRDRIEGFKQALRDLLEAARRADQEWK